MLGSFTVRHDFSRLMNARGNALLIEERERKLVNKQMPKIEQELHALIKGKLYLLIISNDFTKANFCQQIFTVFKDPP